MWRTHGFHKPLAVAILFGACGSNTEVVNSWKDPTASARHFNKVLAVFITKDAGMRRAAEDALAARIKGSVASYTVVPEPLLGDREKAKAWIKQEGFDGAVIMRPVKVDQETTYVPGQSYVVPSYYGSMYGYWGTGWGYAYDPGYVRKDEVVSVEANVYSVADEKLLWASRTKSYNPESARQLVDEIVNETVAEMKRQKALAGH